MGRESKRESERRGVAERERERERVTESEAGSRLSAANTEADSGLELVNRDIMT